MSKKTKEQVEETKKEQAPEPELADNEPIEGDVDQTEGLRNELADLWTQNGQLAFNERSLQTQLQQVQRMRQECENRINQIRNKLNG